MLLEQLSRPYLHLDSLILDCFQTVYAAWKASNHSMMWAKYTREDQSERTLKNRDINVTPYMGDDKALNHETSRTVSWQSYLFLDLRIFWLTVMWTSNIPIPHLILMKLLDFCLLRAKAKNGTSLTSPDARVYWSRRNALLHPSRSNRYYQNMIGSHRSLHA